MPDSFKNSYKVEEKEMVSLSVHNVGFQRCEPLYQWGPGIRDHYLIHHIVSGKGCYSVNGTTFSLEAGDTFLVYPYTEVTYSADDTEPWEYYWVGFAGSDAAAILQVTDFTPKAPFIKQSSYGDSIRSHLLRIYEARGNTFENAVEMTGRLYTALALFIKHSSHKQKRQDTYLTYAQRGVEFISANYSYPITIEDIASYVGISRSHLFRAFQIYLGKSPKEYLSSYRIKQACLLLKQSDLSITAISKSVGFENNLYFSKAFHKAKGLSPTAYAQKHSNP